MSIERNYMIESLNEILEYGILDFTIDNELSYSIYIGEDDKFRLMKRNTKFKVFTQEDKKEFVNALSYIASASFDNKVKLEFCGKDNHVRGGHYEKMRLLSAITGCYLTMLDDKFFGIYSKTDSNIQSIMRRIGDFMSLNEEYENPETYEIVIKDCSYNFYKHLLSRPNYRANDSSVRKSNSLSMYGDMLDKYSINMEEVEVKAKTGKKKTPNVKTSKKLNTSVLDNNAITYINLTDKKYDTNPAIGRDKEIRKLGSTLLSPLLSPVLLGEAGVGKTAIVQGIAYAIQNKNISSRLLDKKILEITPNSLVSGTRYRGDFEQRVEIIVKFLKDNPDVILYFDELHTAKGLGKSEDNGNDLINSLKPYIGNGETKIIGATTQSEYDKYLKPDRAFTRRLKSIEVCEPDNEILRMIINSNIDKFENDTKIKFGSNNIIREEMIDYLIDVTNYVNRMPGDIKYNPGLALAILSEAYGYADYDLKKTVNPDYLVEATKECNNLLQESIKPKTKALFLKTVIADGFKE